MTAPPHTKETMENLSTEKGGIMRDKETAPLGACQCACRDRRPVTVVLGIDAAGLITAQVIADPDHPARDAIAGGVQS